MRVLTVVGNRPQFIKAAAVSRHLRERGEEILVNTGQHYDRELSDVFFDELEIPEPDFELGVRDGTHADQTARTMTRLEPVVDEVDPDAVLVYGDTNATLAGALVASMAGLPLAHVEAGMRSYVRTMAEEINRISADFLSDLLLCSTPTAVSNLEHEGRGEHARLVGDVMADIALAVGAIARESSDAIERFGLEERRYLLVTAHRAENVDDPIRLKMLVSLLCRISEDAPVFFPVHPRTAARLETTGLGSALDAAGVSRIPPVGYVDLTRLLQGSSALLTDSGGLQKEAFLAGIPCVTLRPVTEWTETVVAGWNRLVDLDADGAVEALSKLAPLRDGDPPDASIYGGGRAGERVAEELASWVGQ